MNKPFRFLIKFLITGGFIYLILRLVKFGDVIAVLRYARFELIFFALCISCLPFFLSTLRWRILLRAHGYVFSYGKLFLLVVSSQFFNLFLPNFIAGDIYRTFMLSIENTAVEKKKVFSTVILDRTTGVLGLGIVSVAAYLWGRHFVGHANILIPMVIFWSAILLLIMGMFSKRCVSFVLKHFKHSWGWVQKIQETHGYVYMFRRQPRAVFLSIVLSVIMQALSPVWCFILFYAVGQAVPLIAVLVIVPIVLTIASLPITFSGIGARETAMVYFFYQLGVAKESSLAVSLLLALSYLIVEIIGGVIYVIFYHRRLQSYKNMA